MAALQSLNQVWGRHSFHERLGELARIRPGNAVLDLGCGVGQSLDALLKRAGALGRVVALDRDPRALDAIREDRADAIKSGRLAVVEADIAGEMPLSDGTFDIVICQNVIECVQDKDWLDFHGVARPAKRKLEAVNAASRLSDLAIPPANRLEKLKGSLKDFHSIRINDQWRIVFKWFDGDAYEVRIADYH